MGRGWGRTNGDGVGMGAAPMGTVWGRGKNSGDGVGMGMKFITMSFSTPDHPQQWANLVAAHKVINQYQQVYFFNPRKNLTQTMPARTAKNTVQAHLTYIMY